MQPIPGMRSIAFSLAVALLLLSSPAFAIEPTPGAACSTPDAVTTAAGPENGGVINLLVCASSKWTPLSMLGACPLYSAPIMTANGWGCYCVNPGGSTAGVTWTARGSTGTWHSVAMSANGLKMAATQQGTGKYIYTSTDGGVTWTQRTSSGARDWNYIASSADGTKLVANEDYGYLYASSDSGATWTALTSGPNGGSIAYVRISADGNTIMAPYAYSSQMNYSSNFGSTWSQRGATVRWVGLGMSADGTKVLGVGYNDNLYVSTNGGTTMTAKSNVAYWTGGAVSPNGTYMVAADSGGYIYVSIDSGNTWAAKTASGARAWYNVRISDDGQKIVGLVNGGNIYVSNDGGTSFSSRAVSGNWYDVDATPNLSRIAATLNGGNIYTSVSCGAP